MKSCMRNSKKIFILACVLMLGLSCYHSTTAFAATKVTATPSKTKVTVDGKAKSFEAYTIDGEDYYKLIDLAYVFSGKRCEFGFYRYEPEDALIIQCELGASETVSIMDKDFRDGLKSALAKGDGKKKDAVRVYPLIYFNNMVKNPVVYRIGGTDYYKLTDIMDLINCSVIKNKKTGVVNFNTNKYYEPAFAPIAKGSAAFMKLQQDLYDAYFKYNPSLEWSDKLGSFEGIIASEKECVDIPDNATLYIPRGVVCDQLRFKMGKNSSLVVRGRWDVEDQVDGVVRYATKNTKGTLVFHGNKGNVNQEAEENTYSENEPEVVTVDVKGRTSYNYYNRYADKSMQLMPLLVTAVAKNIGKKVTIDKIEVQNANYSPTYDKVIKSKATTISVNWTIDTTAKAQVYDKKALWAGVLQFRGLEKSSYIVKYTMGKQSDPSYEATDYRLLTPMNEYTIYPRVGTDEVVLWKAANIASLEGKKGAGKNDYKFTVSPFSTDISIAKSFEYYPQNATVTTEAGKTFLNVTISNAEGNKTESEYDYIMVMYHKKGDPDDSLKQLTVGDTDLSVGKIDLTQALSALSKKGGAVQIDKLFVYRAVYDDVTSKYLPSLQYAEASFDPDK